MRVACLERTFLSIALGIAAKHITCLISCQGLSAFLAYGKFPVTQVQRHLFQIQVVVENLSIKNDPIEVGLQIVHISIKAVDC